VVDHPGRQPQHPALDALEDRERLDHSARFGRAS
jgi:hypothetical protein